MHGIPKRILDSSHAGFYHVFVRFALGGNCQTNVKLLERENKTGVEGRTNYSLLIFGVSIHCALSISTTSSGFVKESAPALSVTFICQHCSYFAIVFVRHALFVW